MKMNHGYAGFGLIAITLATPLPVMAMSQDEFNTIAAEIFAPVMEEYDLPGLTVGVTWQGENYIYTAGMADQDASVPVTPDTIFELGSNTKTFNVTLAALAEERGLWSLNDKVSGSFPELEGSDFGTLSLMDMATHQTSGLPVQVPDEVTDDAGMLAWLQNRKPLAAGHERSYSNISIGLLGQATAKSFGQSYADALREHVLQPFELNSTFVDVPDSDMSRYAFGYLKDDDKPVRVNPGMFEVEAYGVKSSVTDMLRFLEINLGDVTVSSELTKAIAKTHYGQTKTEHFTQAMIWERYPWPVSRDQLLAGNAQEISRESQPATRLTQAETSEEGVMFSKTGSTGGFGSYLAFVPDEDIGLVMLSNRVFPNQVRVDAGLSLIQAVLQADE